MAKTVSLLFRGRPLRQLTHGATRTGGRNSQGRITSFHRGGGSKRLLRVIDMKRNIPDLTGTVERIEYDPFRTGRTALIRWDQERQTLDNEEGLLDGNEKAVRRVKDLKRNTFPRGIYDLPRRALRSAVATICGVSVDLRKSREPTKVVIDGKKKFSSLVWNADRGIASIVQNKVHLFFFQKRYLSRKYL